MEYLLYIIPIVVVALIAVFGFMGAKSAAAKYQQAGETEEKKPTRGNIYESSAPQEQDGHAMGPVRSVIRGRIRYVMTGLLFVAIGLGALYVLFFMPDLNLGFERKPLYIAIAAVLFVGAIVWGLQLMNIATYRVKLRRTGFEIGSILGKKGYSYEDVDFYLTKTIERSSDVDGYKPAFGRMGGYVTLWVCQILFRNGKKPIVLKSSRYAQLHSKITPLLQALKASGEQEEAAVEPTEAAPIAEPVAAPVEAPVEEAPVEETRA